MLVALLGVIASCGIFHKTAKYTGPTGQIEGMITDVKTGEPIMDASILILHSSRGAKSDTTGNYVIRNVRIGAYTLRVSHLDYQTMEIPDVTVIAALMTTVDVQMELRPTPTPATVW